MDALPGPRPDHLCADAGPNSPRSQAEYEADIAFLLLRASAAGSCDFTGGRWTGTSSNALVKVAYGGEQDAMPWDRGDYAACVRTFKRLPRHRKTAAVRAALRAAREHYLSRYPLDRSAAHRAQRGQEAKARREQEAERSRRNWKRRQARAAKASRTRVAALSPTDRLEAE